MTLSQRIAARAAAIWGLLFLILLAFAVFSEIGGGAGFGRWARILLAVFAAGVLLATLLTALAIRRFLRRPLERLADASARAAAGDFSRAVPEEGLPDEIRTLAHAFNGMMRELGGARAALAARAEGAEGSLARTGAELARARRVASAGALAAAFAHDLANPVAGMRAAVDRLLAAPGPDERSRESLSLLSEGLERLEGRVRDLLRFAREEPRRERFSLRAAAESAARFVAHRFEERGVRLANEVPAEATALGDPDEASQVLLNLLLNAADASPREATVRVLGGADGDRAFVEVRDEGPGIEPEALARVFEPFRTTKGEKGSGLGLFVSRAILRHAGGDLVLESVPGKGTRARAILPGAAATPGAEKADS